MVVRLSGTTYGVWPRKEDYQLSGNIGEKEEEEGGRGYNQ